MNRKAPIVCVALLIVVMAAACAMAAENAETKPLKVRVAAQPTSGQVFQFIADAHGFNAEEAIDVEMVWLSNLSDAASALMAGQVDVLSTYGTGGPLIYIANGQDLKIFGGYMIIGETPVYGKPEMAYTGLESFKGKRIGLTRGGTPDIVLSEADLENVRAEKMNDSFPNKNVTDREDFAAHQSDGGRADGGRAALRQNAKPVAA